MIEVFVIDVGDDRDDRRQAQERAIAFVGFGDQETSLPHPRIGAERPQTAADNDRGIESAGREHFAHHRGGGGLAVTAGDADPVLQPHEFAEHLGARDDRNATPARFDQLRIAAVHRRGIDNHVRALDIVGGVAGVHRATEQHDTIGGVAGPEIRTGDGIAETEQHLGDPAHAGSADADEVNVTGAIHRACSS